jgi:hypothetical protein
VSPQLSPYDVRTQGLVFRYGLRRTRASFLLTDALRTSGRWCFVSAPGAVVVLLSGDRSRWEVTPSSAWQSLVLFMPIARAIVSLPAEFPEDRFSD